MFMRRAWIAFIQCVNVSEMCLGGGLQTHRERSGKYPKTFGQALMGR